MSDTIVQKILFSGPNTISRKIEVPKAFPKFYVSSVTFLQRAPLVFFTSDLNWQ